MPNFAKSKALRMFTRSQIKVNTAILVFLAFFFRIVFVNASLLPSFNNHEGNRAINSHFSTVLKKRKRCSDVANQAAFEIAAPDMVCEENSGDKGQTKIQAPAILSLFHSLFKQFAFIFSKNRPFDSIKCDLYPKTYLALSVLRI